MFGQQLQLNMNIKPKGGRGKKAPYTTIQMRVPTPLKDEVNLLIERYRAEVLSGINVQTADEPDQLRKFLEEWKARSDSQSPTNQRWQWARKILDDLGEILK